MSPTRAKINPDSAYWSGSLPWVGIAWLVIVVAVVFGGPFGIAGSGSRIEALLNVLESVGDHTGLLIAYSAFAGGIAVAGVGGSYRDLVRPMVICFGLIFVLVGILDPWLTYVSWSGSPSERSTRFLLGIEWPWIQWEMRSHVIEFGIAGGGPDTPEVKSQLHGFAAYYVFLNMLLTVTFAVSGIEVGRRLRHVRRLVARHGISWSYWIILAGGFYLGLKIRVDLTTYAGWSAEQGVLLCLVIPGLVSLLLLLDRWFRLIERNSSQRFARSSAARSPDDA